MDRLEASTTWDRNAQERTLGRTLSGRGTALAAVGGLAALALTGCPGSQQSNNGDMATVSDMAMSATLIVTGAGPTVMVTALVAVRPPLSVTWSWAV